MLLLLLMSWAFSTATEVIVINDSVVKDVINARLAFYSVPNLDTEKARVWAEPCRVRTFREGIIKDNLGAFARVAGSNVRARRRRLRRHFHSWRWRSARSIRNI